MRGSNDNRLSLHCFFVCFLKSPSFEVELKKRDHIDHGPGCFKAASNRGCLIWSVAVCIARRLCNQACELDIWRKDSVSDHWSLLKSIHSLNMDVLMCSSLHSLVCSRQMNMYFDVMLYVAFSRCLLAVAVLGAHGGHILESCEWGRTAISLLTFCVTRTPQGLTLQWWM